MSDVPSQAMPEPPPGRIPLLNLNSHVVVPAALFERMARATWGAPVVAAPAPSEPSPPPVDPRADLAMRFPHPDSLQLVDHIPGFRRVVHDAPPPKPPPSKVK